MKKRIFKIIIVIIMVIIISIYYAYRNNFFSLESLLKDGVNIMEKVFFFKSDNDNTYLTDTFIKSLEEENKELKDLLELKSLQTEYQLNNATVLTRNNNYWLENITIDKGEKDGIKENSIVINKYGLVGKVSKVNSYGSEVILMTNNEKNNRISVSINGYNGIYEEYDSKNSLGKLIGFNNEDIINKGDSVYTSGLGGIYPKGIFMGIVKKIISDNYDISKIVYFTIPEGFDKLNYVAVLAR